MKIKVKNKNAIKAYKVLKRKLDKDGFQKELRKKEYFMSKGERKRKELAIAKRRAKKERLQKQEELEKEDNFHYNKKRNAKRGNKN